MAAFRFAYDQRFAPNMHAPVKPLPMNGKRGTPLTSVGVSPKAY
jgi:hypothetical protein